MIRPTKKQKRQRPRPEYGLLGKMGYGRVNRDGSFTPVQYVRTPMQRNPQFNPDDQRHAVRYEGPSGVKERRFPSQKAAKRFAKQLKESGIKSLLIVIK